MKRIRIENLKKRYGRKLVVKGVSLEVQEGEIVGLLGPNGAGKTTIFNMIVGFVKPSGGKIFFGNVDITKYPMYKRARLGISYLPQEHSIFQKLTVEENIMAILEHMDMPTYKMIETKERLLDELDLRRVAKQKGYTLSGGEKRRVEVARALTTDPSFILLDEPFVGIDPIVVAEIQSVINKLRDTKRIGIIITDHNVRETLKITDRAYIINKGEILIHGNAQKLISSKKAREIYLGHDFTM